MNYELTQSFNESYNHANEILPGLWLGNKHAASDPDFILGNKIEIVYNCTKDLPFIPLISKENRYRVYVDDNLEEAEIKNMEIWAREISFSIIKSYTSGKHILVHCYAGIQRSATCIVFLLIALKGMSAQEAIQYVKQRRPIAFYKNANFMRSILHFENEYNNIILPNIIKR
jgi:hypothetical protein